jgi:MoxR-like ATPase
MHGVSSRALFHLVSAAKANARLHGRSTVTIEDVREMAPFVLRHRLVFSDDTSADDVLQAAMNSVPMPVPAAVPDAVELA